jgi:hypothetical protein
MGGLSAELRHTLLWGNAAGLYGIDRPDAPIR